MRETVCLRPDRTSPGQIQWAWVGSDGNAESGTGSMEDAAVLCQGGRVVFLAPADMVLLTRAVVPARKRQRILQALPYVLEDRLVQDVELLHFAIGARDADGAINVAIVERELLQQWLSDMRAAGIEPDAIIPESLALPFEADRWSVLRDGALTLVRNTRQGGFTVDNENLMTVLSQTLEEDDGDMPAAITLYAAEAMPEFELLSGLGVEIESESLEEAPLALLARHLDERHAIDLLQGAFSRREEFSRIYRPWIAAGAVLALLLGLQGGMLWHDHRGLSQQAEGLQQDIERSYFHAFPDANRVVNPRVQMERGLESLRRGGSADAGGFLDMMRVAAPSLTQIDGLVINRINYRDERLDLALSLQNLQQVDQLRQRVASESGLAIDIQSASAQADRVDARVQLRVPAP